MAKHRGNQGGRKPLDGRVMTEQLIFRAPQILAEEIELRRQARGVPPETAAMIRYLIKLGIEADIRNFEVAD